jgi:hypothetical protein
MKRSSLYAAISLLLLALAGLLIPWPPLAELLRTDGGLARLVLLRHCSPIPSPHPISPVGAAVPR